MITETLMYSNYEITRRVRSRIDPSADILLYEGLRCPRCSTTLKGLEHWEKTMCHKCNLVMSRSGNALRCRACENGEDPKDLFLEMNK